MKFFIICALIAATQATVLVHPGHFGTGASTQYRTQDGLGGYAFGYNEGHGSGATFRKESGANGVVAGSYGLSHADGRQRVVNYVADAAGFRADIKTNEQGVEPKDPAHTAINKAIVPAVHYAAAPAAHYAAAPAAVHYAAAPGALHYAAGHSYGAYAYNTAVGHHGLSLGHHYVW